LHASTNSLQQKSFKKLIIIQLSGGNDWLNTIIPYKNEIYYKLRPKIAVPANKVIPISNDLAFHPSLESLKKLVDQKEMAIVNNVGYANSDKSHFRSMDIWQSGSASNEYLNTGWLGRYLDNHATDAYEAWQGDLNLSLALKGNRLSGIAINNLKFSYNEIQSPFFKELTETLGDSITVTDNQSYLYNTLSQTYNSINYLNNKNNIVNNTKEYPTNLYCKQLKNIASLIASEAATKIYYITLNGFDTHVNQTTRHEKLLNNFAEGLNIFIENLKEFNKWDDTLILTFSEFGRSIEENTSAGTDHGTAGNVLLFGKNLKMKGVVNEAADLGNLINGDLKHTVDFRSIYKDVLQNWLQVDAEKIIAAKVNKVELI
jgi:uncharacterized protein (DUF1501 family)